MKTYRVENSALDNVFINDDLTQYRANLAQKARQGKNMKTIDDTWTIYVDQNGHHLT